MLYYNNAPQSKTQCNICLPVSSLRSMHGGANIMGVDSICQQCGTKFIGTPGAIRKGHAKYCSWECSNMARRGLFKGDKSPTWKGGEVDMVCPICRSKFKLPKAKVKEGRRFCSQSCGAINSYLNAKKSDTTIERMMESELKCRGVSFIKQHAIPEAKTIPDFFISPNIVIYCDGDFWHRIPDVVTKDSRQNFTLNFLGFKVFRFWEKEIKADIGKCVNKILKSIRKVK